MGGPRSGLRGGVWVAPPTSSFLLPAPILPSPPHFCRLLPTPQDSGQSPAEPNTHRVSAAACRALASSCGAERRAAAAHAAPWCPSARAAAPWTAPIPARRLPERAASALPPSGPRFRSPAARGLRHPGSSSLKGSPVRPPATRRCSQHLAVVQRARERSSACGGPGEAQCGLGHKGAPVWLGDAETVFRAPAIMAGTPVSSGPGAGWSKRCCVPADAEKYTEPRGDPGLRV